jgi:protein-S-isoprenylcysteine O-methyltransferase Ste14
VEFILLKRGIYSSLIISGFTVLIIGTAFRMIAIISLRNNFSMVIESKDTGHLVVTGIYKYIRHPMYLGVLLISISGSIMFSCLICWVLVIMTIIAILIRIKKEELFLSEHFNEYHDYAKNSFRLIPMIY